MYPHPQVLVSGYALGINIVSRQVNTPSPTKGDGVIDPQLSQSHLAHQHASPLFDFDYDTGARHRAYVPHMSGWHNASSPTHEGATEMNSVALDPQQSACVSERDAVDDDDYHETFQRSPTRTAYPDPAEFGGLPVAFSPFEQEQQNATVEFLREPSSGTENTGLIRSPVLKGVIYPGMDIFDSASPEAQRRRNQKKDGSRIEQMQNDSAAVEQLERIYFPIGTLKKERLITGNVESSPPRESSPPPVPKKRQRTKVNKAVLRDLSTNGLKVGKRPRQRKTATPLAVTETSNLQHLAEKALATPDENNFLCPRSTLMGYDPMDEEGSQRYLTYGATDNVRRQDFKIFTDDIDRPDDYHHKSRPKLASTSFPQTADSDQSLHSHGSGSTRRRVPLATCQPSSQRRFPAQPRRPAGESLPQTFGEISASMADDRENRQPKLYRGAEADDTAEPAFEQRITQRYFSVTGNQAPQYFSTLPPQMDFGGLSEPRYYGTTLNPLNTHLHSPYTAQKGFH